MSYWLLKSEPNAFCITDLENLPRQTTAWDGVRNYQARNYLSAMQKDDEAFFYHSSCKIPGITGIVKIINTAYPEKNSLENWISIDVQLIEKFPRIISLSLLRAQPDLADMIILRRGNRLSVTPLTIKEWKTVLKLLT